MNQNDSLVLWEMTNFSQNTEGGNYCLNYHYLLAKQRFNLYKTSIFPIL